MNHIIYLIRHAQTEANALGKYIGVTDEPLSSEGIKELEAYIKAGCYPSVDYVFVSPKQRCLQTKKMIYDRLPYEIIPELAECNFGFFENKNYNQLKNTIEYQEWLQAGAQGDFPQGEKIEDFKTRCEKGFAKAVNIIMNKKIKSSAFIIHGGTIMAILTKYALAKAFFHDWKVKNCEGYRLVFDSALWQRQKKILEVTKIKDTESRSL